MNKFIKNVILIGTQIALSEAQQFISEKQQQLNQSKRIGYKVDKKYIHLEEPIKSLGNYFALIDFGDDITAKVKLKVIAE